MKIAHDSRQIYGSIKKKSCWSTGTRWWCDDANGSKVSTMRISSERPTNRIFSMNRSHSTCWLLCFFFFHLYFLLRRETVFSSLMPSYECLRMSYECDCMNLSDVRMECALKPFQEAFIIRFEMFSVRKMFVAVYRLRTMDRIECQCSAPLMTNMNWCSGLVCENHKI